MKGITMAQWINLFRNNGFVLWMPITFLVRKIGFIHIAELGLTAGGRQVVVRQNKVNLENFKSLYIEIFDFLLHLTKV